MIKFKIFIDKKKLEFSYPLTQPRRVVWRVVNPNDLIMIEL